MRAMLLFFAGTGAALFAAFVVLGWLLWPLVKKLSQ